MSSVLLSLPGFFSKFDDTTTDNTKRLLGFVWLAWITITLVVSGAVAEITAERSDRAAGRLPYLGAVGNGLIWLGAALVKVVVASDIIWGSAIRDMGTITVVKGVVLFSLEELRGLVSM